MNSIGSQSIPGERRTAAVHFSATTFYRVAAPPQGVLQPERNRAAVASISRRAIDNDGGMSGNASGANQRTSAISRPSGRRSPPAYSAVKAIINECGNAHDWLAKSV